MHSFSIALVAAAIASAQAGAVPHKRAVTLPPANGKFDYQLGGAYAPDSSVKVLVRDRTASPVSGLYNICYINAFQTQAEEESFWKCMFTLHLCRPNLIIM
jgi:hypothetical protein